MQFRFRCYWTPKLIAAQWDDVLRLTTSVRTGTVRASLMLKRLGAYPRQNGLALALREIGRIERTLYALDWLEQPALRRQATAELNKGESHNALSRAVCFHRLGRLHDRTAQSQQHRASGLALVTAAIVLWNTVYLGRALDAARRHGDLIPAPACPDSRGLCAVTVGVIRFPEWLMGIGHACCGEGFC